MEKEKSFYEALMIRVLDGQATAADQKALDQWLAKNPSHQKEYADFQKIWTAVPDAKLLGQLEIEKDLAAVKAKARQATTAQATKTIALPIWRKIAAILLPLAVIASVLFFFRNPQPVDAPIVLSDGTKVWLYKNADLDFPKNFDGNQRLVQLQGEAYFDVAKNANKPFIIEAGAARIQVIGTSFNVQSTATNTAVIVNSGEVQLMAASNPQEVVHLTKGEKGVYAAEQVSESINTDKNYQSWHTGVFEFDGSIPIELAIQQLSKYYGPIEFDVVHHKDCLLQASFEKQELSKVLAVIESICKD